MLAFFEKLEKLNMFKFKSIFVIVIALLLNFSLYAVDAPSDKSTIGPVQGSPVSTTKEVNNPEKKVVRKQTVSSPADLKLYNEQGKRQVVISSVLQEGIDSEVKDILNDSYNKKLNIANPIFMISEGINTTNYIYSSELCSIVNISDSNLTCLVYPVEKKKDIPSYLRRGLHSDKYKETGVNGDFVIARSDVYKLFLKGEGPLAGSPYLDLVMFLNGDYFFMFADKSKSSFSIEQLLITKGSTPVVVGYLNAPSRKVFEDVVRPLFPKNKFYYKAINIADAVNNICKPTNVDVFIFLGQDFPSSLKEVLTSCSKSINPLTFSDANINVILENNHVFSVANVINYYDSFSVMNFVETYIKVEKSYRQKLIEEEDRVAAAAAKLEAERKAKAENSLSKNIVSRRDNTKPKSQPRPKKTLTETKIVRNKRTVVRKKDNVAEVAEKPVDEIVVKESYLGRELVLNDQDLQRLEGVEAKIDSKFLGIFPDIKHSMFEGSNVYVTGNTVVKTFGIRHVLLATRYTKRDVVMRFFDGLIKDYFLIKENLLTPDMSKFSIKDILLGSSVINNFRYHVGVFQYVRYMLERKVPKTDEQNIAIRLLATNVREDNIPTPYGPQEPDIAQYNIIAERLKDLNKKKKELASIKIFQRDVKNIQMALLSIKEGKSIPNSVLEATGMRNINVEDVDITPVNETETAPLPAEKADNNNNEGTGETPNNNKTGDSLKLPNDEVNKNVTPDVAIKDNTASETKTSTSQAIPKKDVPKA